jgi:hypothetical protein
LERAIAWMTFTTTFLRQMNSRPLAGLFRIEGDCMMNGGNAVGHIGIEVSGTLLFLSFLSCGAEPSLFVLLCSRAKADLGLKFNEHIEG